MGSSSRELKSLIGKRCDQDHSDECHKEYRFYNTHMNPNSMITAMATNTSNARSSRSA